MVAQSRPASSEAIRQVRSFNRLVTERIGALEEGYLARGRPLGASRLLWEIGDEGADVRELRARLGLDSGYASRLLRLLEADGLIEVGESPQDRRVRFAKLTARGRSERALLDARSDDLAASLLAPLDEARQARLVAAMADVERLLTAAAVELREVDPGEPDARHCLRAYFGELSERTGVEFDVDRDLPAPEEMRAPSGTFVVAYLRDRPVGCGGLKRHDDYAELKRMWVDPTARGLGVGRRLLVHFEGIARLEEIATLRLDTNAALAEAIAMYRSAGYADIPRYTADPFATNWFEKSLR